MHKNIIKTSNLIENCTNLPRNNKTFFIAPTDQHEVLNIIKGIKNKKSTGFDENSVEAVKRTACSISRVLADNINLSFQTGHFPNALKKSIVVPLIKKCNSINLDNLRPISLLSVSSKIIE